MSAPCRAGLWFLRFCSLECWPFQPPFDCSLSANSSPTCRPPYPCLPRPPSSLLRSASCLQVPLTTCLVSGQERRLDTRHGGVAASHPQQAPRRPHVEVHVGAKCLPHMKRNAPCRLTSKAPRRVREARRLKTGRPKSQTGLCEGCFLLVFQMVFYAPPFSVVLLAFTMLNLESYLRPLCFLAALLSEKARFSAE